MEIFSKNKLQEENTQVHSLQYIKVCKISFKINLDCSKISPAISGPTTCSHANSSLEQTQRDIIAYCFDSQYHALKDVPSTSLNLFLVTINQKEK